MKEIPPKEKRGLDIRIPLLSEKARVVGADFDEFLEMSDVAIGGIFFKSEKLFPSGTKLEIILGLPGDLGNLMIDSKVIRIAWVKNKKRSHDHKGFAVKFEPMSPNISKIWDAYRVYLRNKQIITVSKRIIEEFFGSNGPKKEF